MKLVFLLLAAFAGLVWWMLHGEPRYTDTPIAVFPVDDGTDLLRDVERVGGRIDSEISSDGNGSLRIDFDRPRLVNLYEIWRDGDDVGFRQLVYEAKLKTENATGPVFLLMQAGVSGAPEGGMPVIGLDKALTGTNEWTTVQIWAGNPANARLFEARLQLESRGTGTVWIDDVRLLSRQVH